MLSIPRSPRLDQGAFPPWLDVVSWPAVLLGRIVAASECHRHPCALDRPSCAAAFLDDEYPWVQIGKFAVHISISRYKKPLLLFLH